MYTGLQNIISKINNADSEEVLRDAKNELISYYMPKVDDFVEANRGSVKDASDLQADLYCAVVECIDELDTYEYVTNEVNRTITRQFKQYCSSENAKAENECAMSDTISVTYIDTGYHEELLSFMKKNLTEREYYTICEYFGFNGKCRILRDIGKDLRVSTERVRMFRDKALSKLRLAGVMDYLM